jgi:hypoxanthine phosphoribosyltransferase
MEHLWSWIFGVTTIIGSILTIYYGRKASQLELARKKLDWADLQSCANDLGVEIKRSFIPDVIFTPGLRGGTFANLLLDEFNNEVPVFVGMTSWKDNPSPISTCGSFLLIETNKWYVHIPECILNYKDKNLLIVDDFAMSGDFLEKIRGLLVSNGFEESKIKTACVVTTKVALHSHKAPNFYWMQTPDDNFYFPWGRAK